MVHKCLNLNYVERPQSIEDIFDILKGKREETISITTIFPAEKIDITKDIINEVSKNVSTVTDPKKSDKSSVKSCFKWKQFFWVILFSICFMASMFIFKFFYFYDNICSRSCRIIKININEIDNHKKNCIECVPCLVDKLIDPDNKEMFHNRRLYCPIKKIVYFISIKKRMLVSTTAVKNDTATLPEKMYKLIPAGGLKAHTAPSVSIFVITCE